MRQGHVPALLTPWDHAGDTVPALAGTSWQEQSLVLPRAWCALKISHAWAGTAQVVFCELNVLSQGHFTTWAGQV